MTDPELTRRNFVKGVAGAAFLASVAGAASPAFSDDDFDLDLRLQPGRAASDDEPMETAESCRPDSCAVSCGGSCHTCGDTCSDTCGSSCPDTCRGTCVTCGGDSCNASCQNACQTQRDSCGCPPPPPK